MLGTGLVVFFSAMAQDLSGAPVTAEELKLLREENRILRQQMEKQGALIEALNSKVANLETAETKRAQELAELKSNQSDQSPPGEMSQPFNFGNVHIGGEGGVAFFHSDKRGLFPNSEFRVDEAKLFVEAPVGGDVYFFGELNLATRENDDLGLKLGELYLDFEDVSKLWGQTRQLNLRAGRFDIPFGEEYMFRDAIDNPLISHSLTDFWGVDEGVEFYGAFGKFSYAVAVQNGGIDSGRDFNPDKAVIARVSFDPTRWLHLSVSGMRTGDLDVENDHLSEMWFGNGWFRSIGSTNTTAFKANLVEGDIVIRLSRGQVRAFGGYVNYDDNDPSASNCRDMFFYSFEGVAELTRKFYVGARFSQILSEKGYPIPANGDFNEYFFQNLTQDIWRLSLGAGYHVSSHLVVKTEYTLEQRKTLSGENCSGDLFAAEAAFGF